jgi:hypothetical protein
MIPKEAGVDVIEKQRPLKLQESLNPAEATGLRRQRSAFGRTGWLGRGSDLECVTPVSLPFLGGAVHYSTSDDQKVAT